MKSVNEIRTVIVEIDYVTVLIYTCIKYWSLFITECERQSGIRPSERSPVDNIGVSQASIKDTIHGKA